MDINDINYNNNFENSNTSLKKDIDTDSINNTDNNSSYFINNDSNEENEIIDLNYSDPSHEGTLPLNGPDNLPVSDNKSTDNKDDKGETDLSKLFR